MKKIIFTLAVLLTGLSFQVFGSVPVPSGAYGAIPSNAIGLYFFDFGGNGPNPPYPAVATASTLPGNVTVTVPWWTTSGTTKIPNGDYTMAKLINTNFGYNPWWGGADHTGRPFQDHTTPNENTGTPASMTGYMMVINANANPSKFFDITIDNICPNTKLYFSIWAGNLMATTPPPTPQGPYTNPKLRFVIIEPNDVNETNVLATKSVELPVHTEGPTWEQVYLTFPNTNSTSLRLRIYNDQRSDIGNDLVLDDIAVFMLKPDAAIEGPGFYCENELMNLSAAFKDDGTFGNNIAYQWLYVPTAADTLKSLDQWTLVGGNSAKLTATAAAGFYKLVIGSPTNVSALDPDCCSVSWATEVKVGHVGTLYWNPNTLNQQWDNLSNWLELVSGTLVPATYYPTKCVDVHIPGNAKTYPTLDASRADWPEEDSLACHDIWFHFGGLIGKPHLLKYHYAYVQYNFGTSDGSDNDKGYAGGTNTISDIFSATPMNRGQWYALAAPLQKIASGDFCVGGYPNFWQEAFKSSPNRLSSIDNKTFIDMTGDWFTPDSTNAWDVGKQYNAIAIWAGEAKDGLPFGEGSGYQKNLDDLKGILEMPYFENNTEIPLHQLFSHSDGVSSFQYYYYDRATLDPVPASIKPFGELQRGEEAYRFIIEGPPFSKTGNEYTMTVLANTEIMVGNPFFSQLDFDAFTSDNTGITKYRLYVGNNFTAYSSTAGSASTTGNPTGTDQYIAPLQAFFITPTTSSLTFNADKVAPATPPGNKLRSSTADSNMKADVLYLKAESPAGKSYLTLSMQEVNEKNLILLLPDGYPEVPQIYATDQTGQRNAIQFEGGYVGSVPLGVLSSDSDMITLTVQNADNIAMDSLILWDKYADKKVDLKTTDTYTFRNVPSVSDRFVLIAGNKVITGIAAPEVAGSIRATVYGNTLYVSASSEISSVSVISLEGITLSKVTGIGQNTYTQRLNLPKGVYLVYVKTENGETKAVKIVVNG